MFDHEYEQGHTVLYNYPKEIIRNMICNISLTAAVRISELTLAPHSIKTLHVSISPRLAAK